MLLKKRSRTAMYTDPAAIITNAARQFARSHTKPRVSRGFLFS